MQLLAAAASIMLVASSLGIWAFVLWQLFRRQPIVGYEPHALVPWSGFDVLVLVLAFVLSQIAAQTWVQSGGGASADMVWALGWARAAWFVFAIVYLAASAGASRDDLGFDLHKIGRDAALGISMFLAAIAPVYGVQWFFTQALKMPSEHPLVKFAKEQPGVGTLVLTTIAAAIVAPIVEEFAFRVVLQGWLEKQQVLTRQRLGLDDRGPPGPGPILGVSAIFGALHFGHGPDPYALFVLSLFLGYAYQRTHRIFPPLVIHFCVNALAVVGLWAEFLGRPE